MLFFFKHTAHTCIYTLSLHDALPICEARGTRHEGADTTGAVKTGEGVGKGRVGAAPGKPTEIAYHRGIEGKPPEAGANQHHRRSEEHTSELQSQFHLVCRLLLEKKKK